MYGRLSQFSNQERHCRLAGDYVTEDGYRLGQWVRVQRERQAKLLPERQRRLEALPGWSWDLLSDWWEEGFAQLQEFSDREGNCRVAGGHKTKDGYPLGQWVSVQRKRSQDAERRQLLETLPRWSWDAFSDRWEEGFARLKEFSDRDGHCRVASGYKTEDGYRLGLWVGDQRERRAKLLLDRRQRLEALPGWSWDLFLTSFGTIVLFV